MIPTELKMADLSGLEELQSTLTTNLVLLHGDKGISRQTARCRRVYIRLLDKAVYEYQKAREMIIAQIAEGQRDPDEMMRTGRPIYMFKFVDHMENCLSTVGRSIRFLDALSENQDRLAFPPEVRCEINSLKKNLFDVRNEIEHLDERIQNDVIRANEPVLLKITDSQDGVRVGGKSLQFSTLSTLIGNLHALGRGIAAWREADNPSDRQNE